MLAGVVAFDPEPWHDLFVMAGGASAALAGLLFVAVSLNLEQVLQYDSLPALAAQSVALLIGLVVESALVLAPGQPEAALGIETLALGLLLSVIVFVPTLRGIGEVEHAVWRIRRVGMAAVSVVPMLVAGVLLVSGVDGALFWLLGEIVCVLGVATYNAWVLLIEIRR